MYDLIIIGAGPAGLSASVYASRYGIKHVILGEVAGGLLTQTFDVGNWLGTEAIGGQAFADSAEKHAKSYGVEILPLTVEHIERQGDAFEVSASGKLFRAKTVLVATGTKHRHLGVPGEQEFAGKGVSFCPTCDGFFFKGKRVAVVGGGDSATEAGVYLADLCSEVFVIVREKAMIAEKFWQNLLLSKKNVKVIFGTNVKEIRGSGKMESLLLDTPFEGSETLSADGLFVEIGLAPNTKLLANIGAKLDERGYAETMPDQSVGVPGVWAAGDITTNSNRFCQIVTAASEGAIAAKSILDYLQRQGAK
ncbi:MAG: NAD(P)/FAD-dependent oxidoreductase [Candidatus Moraniibacteriota bacterium]|nr:MAG: NAD(P)/FAD-dependent oxidoreductase [Candidatus Moranbacteria bacterium]